MSGIFFIYYGTMCVELNGTSMHYHSGASVHAFSNFCGSSHRPALQVITIVSVNSAVT